jgi:hypothetical protein
MVFAMQTRTLTRLTRRADSINIWWDTIWKVGTVVSSLWLLFGLILRAFAPIAEHGWAAVVLAGIAATLALLLLLSLAFLIFARAWRYFRPFASVPIAATAMPARLGEVGNDHIVEMIGRLDQFANAQREHLVSELQRKDNQIAELAKSITKLDQQINEPETAFEKGGSRFRIIDAKLTTLTSMIQEINSRYDRKREGELNRSINILLSYSVYMMNLDFLSYFIELSPFSRNELKPPEDMDRAYRERLDGFVRKVEQNIANTRWYASIKAAAEKATLDAERLIRETKDEDIPESVNRWDFRDNMISQLRCLRVLEVLQFQKNELKDELRGYRDMLIQQLKAHEQG